MCPTGSETTPRRAPTTVLSSPTSPSRTAAKAVAAEAALAIQKIIGKHSKVDFWTDYDAQKVAQNDIDDFLYDQVNDKYGASLSTEQMDEIIEKTMRIARNQRGNL